MIVGAMMLLMKFFFFFFFFFYEAIGSFGLIFFLTDLKTVVLSIL